MSIERKEIEISFGTMFHLVPREFYGDRVDVVTGFGEGDSIHARRLEKDEDGKSRLSWISGTTYTDDFEQIVGQLTPEEVIEAIDRGIQFELGKRLSIDLRDHLKREAQKKPRKAIVKYL